MPNQPRRRPDTTPHREKTPTPASSYTGEYVVCPMCCRSRILELSSTRSIEKGKEGRVLFNRWDPTNSPLVQVRERAEGKGGFRTIRTLTWAEACADPDLAELVEEIRGQIRVLCSLL